MTRPAPQPGDTQATPDEHRGERGHVGAHRGPWSAPGPAGTWWHGDGSTDLVPNTLRQTEEIPIGRPAITAAPEPKPSADPSAEPEPSAEPKTVAEPEPVTVAEPEPAPVAEVEAEPVAAIEPAAAAKAEPVAEAMADVTTEIVIEQPPPDAAHDAALVPVPAVTPEPRSSVVTVPRALPERIVPVPALPADDEPAFWIPSEDVARSANTAWPAPQMRVGRPRAGYGQAGTPVQPPPKSPRRPALALFGLVVFSLLAAFFSWVSAEPLWLAAGHGDLGTATVTRCTGNGVAQRCVGTFAAADGRFTTPRIALLGVAEHQRHEGATVAARMVDRDSRQAYVGDDGLALHLRWGLGLLLVLLCGAGVSWATGATRLETRRARRLAVLASLTGPLLLALGFLAAAW